MRKRLKILNQNLRSTRNFKMAHALDKDSNLSLLIVLQWTTNKHNNHEKKMAPFWKRLAETAGLNRKKNYIARGSSFSCKHSSVSLAALRGIYCLISGAFVTLPLRQSSDVEWTAQVHRQAERPIQNVLSWQPLGTEQPPQVYWGVNCGQQATWTSAIWPAATDFTTATFVQDDQNVLLVWPGLDVIHRGQGWALSPVSLHPPCSGFKESASMTHVWGSTIDMAAGHSWCVMWLRTEMTFCSPSFCQHCRPWTRNAAGSRQRLSPPTTSR